jgi:hypothetical protein
MGTLPGTRLFYEGQFEGRKVRLPVFLSRRPSEPENRDLKVFYKKLLQAVDHRIFREGEWTLCGQSGWPDNSSFQNLVSWSWVYKDERYLVIVNLSDHPAQALVQVPWKDAGDKMWLLKDVLARAIYERRGSEMLSPGLYVDLGPWNYHFFECLPQTKR